MAYFNYTVKDVIKAMKRFDLSTFNFKVTRPGKADINQKLYLELIRKYPLMFEGIAEFCFIAIRILEGKKLKTVLTCPICGRRKHYPSSTCRNTECVVEQRKRTRFAKVGSLDCRTPESIEAQKKTLLARYGVTSPFASKEILEKCRATLKRNLGVDTPAQNADVRKKMIATCLLKYGAPSPLDKSSTVAKSIVTEHESKWGVSYPFQREDLQERIQEHRRLPATEAKIQASKRANGTFNTSSPEDKAFTLLKAVFPKVKRQYRSKDYPFACDFYIPEEDLYIECNFHWTHGKEPYVGTKKQKKKLNAFKSKGSKYYSIAQKVWSVSDVNKREHAKNSGLRWKEFFKYTDFVAWLGESYPVHVKQLRPGKAPKTIICPIVGPYDAVSNRFSLLYNLCLNTHFPGSAKWPANHPIWKCKVSGKLSPIEAWLRPDMVKKAVLNLEKIWTKGENEGKYSNYISRWNRQIQESELEAARVILNRFTVAKIAPKVTAISETAVAAILKQTGLDYTEGIYCPMAGFGGIIRAARNLGVPVEAYDINERFNAWYGWGYRNVLAQKVKTAKVVVVCPPFGENTERWAGTPSNMYFSFEEWCFLIRKYVKATNYVFIGPEKKGAKNKCGLFGKTLGIQWYPNL